MSTILRKKIEDLRQLGAFMVRAGAVGNATVSEDHASGKK